TSVIFFYALPSTPRLTLFPYTTLFRSHPIGQHQPATMPERPGRTPGAQQVVDVRDVDHHAAQHDEFLQGIAQFPEMRAQPLAIEDRKSTRLNSSHVKISYAVFCLKKKK